MNAPRDGWLAAGAAVLVGLAAAIAAYAGGEWAAALLGATGVLVTLWVVQGSRVTIVVWLGLLLTVGDRLIAQTGVGGGSGLLTVGLAAQALLGVLLVVSSAAARRTLAALFGQALPVGVYFAFALALPVVGVFLDYPVRTIVAVLVPLAAIASILMGERLRATGAPFTRAVLPIIEVAVWVNAGAAVIQTLYYRGVTLPFASTLVAWDGGVAEAYGIVQISSRAVGLYSNPNVLALLGAMAFLTALFARVTVSRRVALMIPATIVLLTAQSRGVLIGFIVAIAVGLIFSSRSSSISLIRHPWVVAGSLLGVALVVVGASWFAGDLLTSFVGRLVQSASVLTAGPSADPNFAGRLAFWRSGLELLQKKPLGTFGPPELLLGTATDNDYIRHLLQGGVVYLVSYVVALAWVIWRAARTGSAALLRALTVLVLVSSASQSNSGYVPVIVFMWAVVGWFLDDMRDSERGR